MRSDLDRRSSQAVADRWKIRIYPRRDKFLAEEAASRYGFRIHEIVISYRSLSSPAKYHYVQGISATWKKIQEEIKEGIIDFEMKFRTSCEKYRDHWNVLFKFCCLYELFNKISSKIWKFERIQWENISIRWIRDIFGNNRKFNLRKIFILILII